MHKRLFTAMILAILLVACGEQPIETNTNGLKDQQEQIVDSHSEAATTSKGRQSSEQTTEETTPSESSSQPKDEKQTNRNALPELKVHYIDAGQADATLFQYTEKDRTYTILYDVGDWNKNDVVNYLQSQQIANIDLIIISHPHADHIGQLAEIVQTFATDEVWMSGNESSSDVFQKGIHSLIENDVDYEEPRAGEEFSIGPMDIEILHPSRLTEGLNEDSLSVRFTYGDVRFLFTGDAYAEQEQWMMTRTKDLQADVLQLGHHGSNTSSDASFIEAVDPDVAVYSAGENNSYGHPHPDIISRIQQAGITLYGTDVHGTIIITTDGHDYTALTNKDGTISPKNTASTSKHSNNESEQGTNNEQLNEKNTDSCVDLNQASIEELQQVIHIGPDRAEDIITKRPFQSVDDLTDLNGIGPQRIKEIKEQDIACVGG